jgi:hypothetical protein
MDKRYNLWQTVLIMTMVLLGEVHTFWEHSTVRVKWIYVYPWSDGMLIQNYVKDNGVMIGWILFCVFAYRLGKHPTKYSFFLLGMVTLWKIINIPLYWYNYRTFGYGWVYFGLVAIGTFIYWWQFKRKQ